MCGIAGMFGPEANLTPDRRRGVIAQMCRVIEHRGPDDEGFHIDGGLAIGMRRLSIIDLFTGRQPISNEDGSIWIVFNGEIYNFQEIREDLIRRGHRFQTGTDTEVIVHLYEDEGERCVERLRGMFAFAIWDNRERKLFMARDRVGVKPLHYCVTVETLVFASEIKSILQHPEVNREVNLEAISDFLTFGYVPDPASAFKGIYKLLPGHTLTFKDGRLTTRCYWDFHYHQNGSGEPAREESYYSKRIRELIAESVRLRLISDVPLGAFLSGGVDSSTVVAMMAREMDRPVKTFSIGFTVRGLIPDEIVDRQKQGFGVPIRRWFNNELRELLYDTLTDSRSKQYIEREIPHISSLMNSDLNSVIEASEVIIIGKKEDEFRVLADKLNNGRVIVDLVRLFDVPDAREQYKGICW